MSELRLERGCRRLSVQGPAEAGTQRLQLAAVFSSRHHGPRARSLSNALRDNISPLSHCSQGTTPA